MKSPPLLFLPAITLWFATMAAWVSVCGQVINPTPSNPGPYLGPPNIHLIEAQKDGKVVVAGYFDQFTGLQQKQILRLNADGSFDDSFQPPPLPSGPYGGGMSALLVLPDDKLLVGLTSSNGIVRLNADGTLDPAFQIEPLQNQMFYSVGVSGILGQANGKIIFYGSFNAVGTNAAEGIARVNSDGSFDPTFVPRLTYQGSPSQPTLALNQLDGKLIVQGGFDAVDGATYSGLARLNSDGSLDPTFTNNHGLDGNILDVQSDGRLMVREWRGLGRLMPDGTVDHSFNPGLGISGTNRYLMSARFQKGGCLIYGNFDMYDNQWRRSLARINEDGSLDQGFDARLAKTPWAQSPAIEVRALKVLSDGSFLVAGSFTEVQGKSRTGLARFTAEGNLDESFNAFQPILRAPSITWDGFYQFRLVGELWRPYVVEVSDDLKTWQPQRNVMIVRSPSYYVDLQQPPGHRYYRIRSL